MQPDQTQHCGAINMPGPVPARSKGHKFSCGSLIPSPTSLFLFLSFIISLLLNGGNFLLNKRGFFCNDTTIRYPVRPDTVSFKALLVVALLIPSIVIKFLEKRLLKLNKNCAVRQGMRTRKDSDNLQDEKDEVEELMKTEPDYRITKRMVINDDGDSDLEAIGQGNIDCDNNGNQDDVESSNASSNLRRNTTTNTDPESQVRFTHKHRRQAKSSPRKLSDLQIFLFGFVATAFLTGLCKTASGRLRPHFMARCQPNVDCTLPANTHRYIEDFECTDKTMRPRDYSYITTSWPSGKLVSKAIWLTLNLIQI